MIKKTNKKGPVFEVDNFTRILIMILVMNDRD